MTTQEKTKSSQRNKDIRAFLDKIVVNAGIGRASQLPNFEEKISPQIMRDIGLLSGQVPEVRRARKSIAGFKVREGQVVGVRVTLRRKRMIDFFERLITIVWPRVRDFRGISLDSVDDGGVLNVGFREQTVFPEVNPEQSLFVFSLGISLVPKTKDREKSLKQFEHFGVPLATGKSKK